MEPTEQFQIAREIIRHEDGLVNNRVTWLLVLHGFLFTAFVSGIGLYEKFPGRPAAIACITMGLVLIAAVGIASCLTAYNVIQIAVHHVERTKEWWTATGNAANWPQVAGELRKGSYYWLFSTGRMPCLLAAVWSVLILLLLIGIL